MSPATIQHIYIILYNARHFFRLNLVCADRISLKPPVSNFIEIRPTEAVPMHTKGLTDEQANPETETNRWSKHG
jgi:hypothetical protein